MTLKFFETPPTNKNKAEQLVLFLHGYGSNGGDLISLAPQFAKILPAAHFISPDAPFALDNIGFGGREWFSLYSFDPKIIYPQIINANNILDQFIKSQLERFGLKYKDLILIGFSQGAMMALYNSLRANEEIGAVLSYSGKLILPSNLGEKIKSNPPICLIHGAIDEVVPFENLSIAKRELEELNIDFEAYQIEGLGHHIDHLGIAAGKRFLHKYISRSIEKPNIIIK